MFFGLHNTRYDSTTLKWTYNENNKMKFPEDWQNCPPDDAEPANGVYFRVGRHHPPTADDFKSQAELKRAPTAEPVCEWAYPCSATYQTQSI